MQLIGVDVGGTNLRVGVTEGRNIIHERRSQADFAGICRTNDATTAWTNIIATLGDTILQVLGEYPKTAAVGIGFPGFIDPVTGVIAQSPNLPGLCDVNLARDLTSVIRRPVVVENDALAAAYGEYRLGANNSGNLIYIGLGTGVGGGLILAGKPYAGQHGVAMEVGHLIVEAGGRLCGCGNRGCLEQYASASGVSLSYKISTGQTADATAIAQFAATGDPHAALTFSLAGKSLAQAVAHIVKTVDVGQIVIGGGMSVAWLLMQPAFDERLQADLIPVLRDKIRTRISASDDHAGIIGAALLAGARSGN